jgi:hypothetical protein
MVLWNFGPKADISTAVAIGAGFFAALVALPLAWPSASLDRTCGSWRRLSGQPLP